MAPICRHANDWLTIPPGMFAMPCCQTASCYHSVTSTGFKPCHARKDDCNAKTQSPARSVASCLPAWITPAWRCQPPAGCVLVKLCIVLGDWCWPAASGHVRRPGTMSAPAPSQSPPATAAPPGMVGVAAGMPRHLGGCPCEGPFWCSSAHSVQPARRCSYLFMTRQQTTGHKASAS